MGQIGDMATNKRVRSQAGKLTALGYVEIKDGLRLAAVGLGRALRIGVEKWEPGHLLEAFIVDCLTQPVDEQIRRAKRGQAIVERIRLRKEPGPPLTAADDAVQDDAGPPPKGKGRGNPGHGEIRPGQSAVIDLTRPGREPDRECRVGQGVEHRKRRSPRGVR